MSSDTFGGVSSATAWDQQTFGAGVVAKTLDYMNNQGMSNTFAPVDKQTFGAAVVSKTMDYMNAPSYGSGGGMDSMSQTYSFSKDVLGSYATGIGALANITV